MALSILYLALPGYSSGQSYPYRFNYLTVDEGLSHTDANDIAQDRLGYIWVATYFGLDRFDGYVTRQYYNNNDPINNAFKNRVRCIYPDDSGKIWLGTEFGLQCFDPRTERYCDYSAPDQKSVLHFEKLYKPKGDLIYGLVDGRVDLYSVAQRVLQKVPLTLPAGVHITDMTPDRHGVLYLSSDHGLWALDKNREVHPVEILGLAVRSLSKVCFDEDNHLMTASANTVYTTGTKTAGDNGGPVLYVRGKFDAPRTAFIRDILHGRNGDLWINNGSVLFRVDQRLQLVQEVNNQTGIRPLNTKSLTRAFIDQSQCLWVCTFGGGLNYCDLNEKRFYTFQNEPENPNSLSGNHIRSVLEDGNDLWIGTTANGLNRYDRKKGRFAYYNTYNSPIRIKDDCVESLTLDNDHNLWIGCGTGIQILRPDRKTLWKPPGYQDFPTYGVETLAKDCFGNIWFGDHMDRFGVVWKDKTGQFHVRYYGESYFILADSTKPQLMASSTHGLKRFIIDDQGNILKTYSYNASTAANSLTSNYTYPICRQNDSVYWVGTIGGGLDRLTLDTDDEHYTVHSYTDKDGVIKDIESMEIDNTGNIWMGGNGLECLNIRTGKVIRYDKNDGLQGNSFKVGSSYKGSDGVLYFGGINGLNYFYPGQILSNIIAAEPILTDISINDQRPSFGTASKNNNTIPETIGYDSSLTLNYLQNNFSISFSSMHFASPLKCQYRYRLVGFDKEWNYTDGKTPNAAYSNLDYMAYTFQVQATNNDGLWSKNVAGIDITIAPPWWKSPPAKALYLLLIVMALAGIYLYQARWYRLKRELEVRAISERKREEMHQQREELYQQQLTFFTNISHDFRTPLTLILGPLEALIGQNTNRALDTSYQLMLRNAKRLIHLISELMNFRKVADSVIKLHVEPLSVQRFCRDIASEFQTLADSKGISFAITDHTIEKDQEEVIGHFDVQVLEKILFNLLNNSFKYTNSGGRVTFEIFEDIQNRKPSFTNGLRLLNESQRARRYLYFIIADSGIGISGESLHNIFDRYFRVSANHLGSGIGLALVKSLTKLHKGDIYVYSERNVGTEIIIGIPWDEENYSASEKGRSIISLDAQLEFADNPSPPLLLDPENEPLTPVPGRKRLLLVDDNNELRIFLRQAFEKIYYIYEAEDGQTALEIAIGNIPDLIISDVMMPGMNGIELCKTIKERFETSHIPFIILSAKDALDSKLSGMKSGADYYFAKPLSVEFLRMTVHNIFEQSEKLKQRFATNYLTDATELVHSEKDKKFFQELLAIIEENIQEPELDVDFLCERLFISRSKLYQKVQSTSNQSVAEFIRTIRLKKAIQIMTHEDVSMNEVADRIGMQRASNFSRAFKKEYGQSPLQFMQTLKKDNSQYRHT